MFANVLIANRGEIACRVIRTARRLGIRAIALHTPADRGALFTRLADEAIEIGEGATGYLDGEEDRRDGGGGGRAMPASRLRLPQRERGLRRSLCGRGRRLRRAAAGRDARDGAQELRQGADAEGRRAGGSRLSRRQPEPEIPEGEGLRARLSRADQGDRRRRRPRHAPHRRARRFRRRLRGGDARGARGVRRSARADREIHPPPAPYRSAGVRRPAWPGRAPLRARLLVAAPPSEGDRREPGARVCPRRRARR